MVRIVDGQIVADDAVPSRSRPNVASISSNNNNSDSSNYSTNQQSQQYQYQLPNDGNSNSSTSNIPQIPSFLSSNPIRIALLFFAIFFLLSMFLPGPGVTYNSKGILLNNGTFVTPEEYYMFRNSQSYGFTGMIVAVFITAMILGAYFYIQYVIQSGRPFLLPPGQLNSSNPFGTPTPGANFPPNANPRPTLPRGRGIRTLSDYSSGNNA